MPDVIRSEGEPVDETRIDAGTVLRYSVIFAAIVVLPNLVGLGLPAMVLATWVIGRRFARRYRRQITTRETLQLALASWAWTFVAWLLQTATNPGPLGFVGFLLVWQAVAFVTIWAAYVWLARFMIRRALGAAADGEERGSASRMLAQQEERYAEAKARTLTLVVAWLSVGPLGILLAVLVGVIVAIGLGLMGLEVGEGTPFFVLATLGLPTLLAGGTYFVFRKSAEVFPSRQLVLWLRRFHRADLMEFPFPSFLETVCRGIAVPITLQDSTVAAARTAAELRPAFHLLTGVAAASWFSLAFSVEALLRRESWSDLQSVALGVVAAVALAALVAVPMAHRRLGVLQLGTKRGRRLVQGLLDVIDSREGVPQTLTVVSTPDESWQSWVLEFIQRADAVLVDVTHLSANLHWELRMIAEYLDPEQVILAYGETEGCEPGIPGEIQAELTHLLGREMLERSHRFFYKLPRQRAWRGFPWRTLSRKGWLQLSKASRRLYSQQFAQVLQKAFAASDRVGLPS
jgi:hypothetical protein